MEEETMYLPSQHLCEIVEKAGYEGIAFPSAMGAGSNIVLFNPNDATPVGVKYLRIIGVGYDVRDLKGLEDIYQDWPYDYLSE